MVKYPPHYAVGRADDGEVRSHSVPESPSTSTYVTSSPQLAFKGITRAELEEKVNDGYSLVGNSSVLNSGFEKAVCAATARAQNTGEGVVRRVDPPKSAADWSIRVIDDATPLLQNAIDEVFRLGGGRVVVGSGFYSIKGIRLRSRVTLHLERGAVLQASRNAADFDILLCTKSALDSARFASR